MYVFDQEVHCMYGDDGGMKGWNFKLVPPTNEENSKIKSSKSRSLLRK
jgi:hypothetical protein